MPTYTVEIQNDHNFTVDVSMLTKAIETTLAAYEDDPDVALTVVIETNEAVQALNKQYRQVDSPTDILSFPADEPAFEDEPLYLGDLIIAYPYAAAQAQRLNHDLMESFSLLVIHGTLHLLGYDHDTPEHRAEMWQVQESLLLKLGISPSIVPSLEEVDHHDE